MSTSTAGMRPPTSWSVRRRVLLASVATVLLAVLLGVVGFNLALERILASAAVDEARAQTEQVAALVASGDVGAEAAVAERPARGSVLQLLSPEGTVVVASEGSAASTPLTNARPALGETATTIVDDDPGELGPHVLAARGIQDRDGQPYTLVVARTMHTHDRTVEVATWLLATLGAILVLGLVLLIRSVLDSALAPVERIRAQVDAIDRTGSDERLTVPATGDEIAGLATTMNAMLDRLARSDAAHRRFISDASHELRSPLATIRTTLETSGAADEDAGGERGEEHEVMLRETVRMQQLVDDLLLLARADDQGLALRTREVDLDDLVAEEVSRLRSLGTAYLESRITPARVQGDPVRLTRALRNLTDNALHHTRGTVRVLMEIDGAHALVHVDDEGEPVPVEQREAIFERFVRLDGARSRDEGGSGLGLPIALAIATAHEGSITTGETPEGWCRFTLRLPLAEPPEGD